MTQFKGDPKWYPVYAVPLVVLCLLVATIVGKAATLWETHCYGTQPQFPTQDGPPSKNTAAAFLPSNSSRQCSASGHAKISVTSDIELVEHKKRIPAILVSKSSSESTLRGEPPTESGPKGDISLHSRRAKDRAMTDEEFKREWANSPTKGPPPPPVPVSIRSSYAGILARENSGVSYETQKRLAEMLGNHYSKGSKEELRTKERRSE